MKQQKKYAVNVGFRTIGCRDCETNVGDGWMLAKGKGKFGNTFGQV